MKIYNKVVIDMATGETVEEDSYEHEGSVALCKGGGGGGGSSGTVDFPSYMKQIHADWLDNDGLDHIGSAQSVTYHIIAGLAASPFNGETAYDPDDDITAMLAKMTTFETEVLAVDETTLWDSYATIMKATVDNDSSITIPQCSFIDC